MRKLMQTREPLLPFTSVLKYWSEVAERGVQILGRSAPHTLQLSLMIVFYFLCLGDSSARGAQIDPSAQIGTDEVISTTEARRVACLSLGIPEATQSDVFESPAQLLQQDRTPFLHEDFVRRKPLAVVFRDVELVLTSGRKNNYIRTIRAYLTNDRGQLLKVVTDWPEGESEIAPEREANAATEVLRLSNEIYHSFPDESPKISLMDALELIQEDGGRVATAKQISAVCVVWSRLGSDPKPMWVVTLRGIPPVRHHRNVHPDAVNHLRYVVDPVQKKWVYATTSPQPGNAAPQVIGNP